MKKSLAIVLTLVLALSLTVTAFAADETEANVEITTAGGELDIDPDDIPDALKHLTPENISFGSVSLETLVGDADNGVATLDGDKTTGLVVKNTLSDGFVVTAKVDNFVAASGTALTAPTVKLNTNGAEYNGSNNGAVAASVELVAGSGDSDIVFSAAAGEGLGYSGASWDAELEVDIAGILITGETATATMHWQLGAVA